MTQKVQPMKEQISKFDIIKIQIFHLSEVSETKTDKVQSGEKYL